MPLARRRALVSGLLAKYGIRRIGISGYPEGHPEIGNKKLWQASREKQAAILERGHDFAVITQFSFGAEPVLAWLEQVRKAGILAWVRVGVPGPASVKPLLAFAARCGVGASTKVMKKYGLSLTKLLSKARPDQLIQEYATGLDPARHGEVLIQYLSLWRTAGDRRVGPRLPGRIWSDDVMTVRQFEP